MKYDLVTLLGFDPGPDFWNLMFVQRERILLRMELQKLLMYAKRIFPEEFRR